VKRTPLERRSPLKKGRGFAASEEQREKARWADRECVVCGLDHPYSAVDPAHVIPRSIGGCDHEDCVVPLCRSCHRAYDQEGLDVLPALEGRHRAELAHAVSHVGLIAALERITNTRWSPDA
jgi:5-methylcytosine-specific restriction endonuclease McrA